MKKFLFLSIVFCSLFCFNGVCAMADEGDDPDTYYVTLDAQAAIYPGKTASSFLRLKKTFRT